MTKIDIDADEPIFLHGDVVGMTRLDDDLLESWVRYKHVDPRKVGKRRKYSVAGVVEAELMYHLAYVLKVPPSIGKFVAELALAEYRDRYFNVDLLDIWSGTEFTDLPHPEDGGTTFEMARTPGGVLRGAQQGDAPQDSVVITIPTRLLARSVFAKMKIFMDARRADTDQAPSAVRA